MDAQPTQAPAATEASAEIAEATKIEDTNADVVGESDKAPTEVKVENASKTKLPSAEEVKKRVYKIKYGEKEETLDEDEVVRRAQKVTGIEKKAEEAAKQFKIATNFFKLLKENPLEFAKKAREIGMDPEAMAIAIIDNKLKYEQMTPEQRELEQLRQEKIERDRLDKIKEEEEHKKLLAEQEDEYRQQLENDIVEAYNEVKLPKTPWTTARIAAYLDAGLANGKQYRIKDVAAVVKKEYNAMINEVLAATPEDQILDLLDTNVQEMIAKARVKKLKPKDPVPVVKKEEKKKEEPKLDPRKRKLIREYLRRDDHPDAD